MGKNQDYRDWLVERLRDPRELMAYLEAAVVQDPLEPKAELDAATLRLVIKDAVAAIRKGIKT